MVSVQADLSVNRGTTDAEHDGHIGDRVPSDELEQSELAAVGVAAGCRMKQSPESEPLLGCQYR
jgi:hypothetical protein